MELARRKRIHSKTLICVPPAALSVIGSGGAWIPIRLKAVIFRFVLTTKDSTTEDDGQTQVPLKQAP